MAHEREHLEVRVVRGRELLYPPRLLHRLAQPLRDRHLELHVVRVERAHATRVPEEEPDDAALDYEGAREVERTPSRTSRPDEWLLGWSRACASRSSMTRGSPLLMTWSSEPPLRSPSVALGEQQRMVVRARVVCEQPPAALIHEGEPDAVARDQRARPLEEEVGEVVERLLGGDLLVDHAQGRALGVADAPAARAPMKRVEVPNVDCRLTTAPPADDCHGRPPGQH